MKILFFGRGVVGTQYAWAFENATVLFFNNFWQDPQSAVQPFPLSQIV